eukprot:10967384-Alexandrium_andersonii.AAC.1
MLRLRVLCSYYPGGHCELGRCFALLAGVRCADQSKGRSRGLCVRGITWVYMMGCMESHGST